MCTSITAWRHAAFQDGGASVKPTQPGRREGLRGVRIREVGQSMLGSRLEYRVDNVDEVGRGDSSRQKHFLLGLRG